MVRRVAYLAVLAVLLVALGGCALTLFDLFVPRAPWRDAEEKACLSDRSALATVSYTRIPKINDKGSCGIYAPLKVTALVSGNVTIAPTPTMDCPMASTLDQWMTDDVEPAALAWFGQPVVGINELDAYDCRTVDSIPGENMSEHAFGNAIDIATFTFADGSQISVKRDFLNGNRYAKGFLHEVFADACARFKTALGPGYPEHDDHFHLDLAHQNADGTARYCNPTPDVSPPQRPPYGTAGAVAMGPAANRFSFTPGLDPKTTGSIYTSVAR